MHVQQIIEVCDMLKCSLDQPIGLLILAQTVWIFMCLKVYFNTANLDSNTTKLTINILFVRSCTIDMISVSLYRNEKVLLDIILPNRKHLCRNNMFYRIRNMNITTKFLEWRGWKAIFKYRYNITKHICVTKKWQTAAAFITSINKD